jgi:hypothetical protein
MPAMTRLCTVAGDEEHGKVSRCFGSQAARVVAVDMREEHEPVGLCDLELPGSPVSSRNDAFVVRDSDCASSVRLHGVLDRSKVPSTANCGIARWQEPRSIARSADLLRRRCP